ncbi:MAG TPA: hypothetical protein VL443_02690 [Cyclobacteriaceae bacterium]|jgi:hypothetical protein|nr:hypothetical protein [Cyclobacteriaceae bacterium]
MSFKPDEITLMAYVYGELEGEEKEKVEEYLSTHEDARAEIENLQTLRKMMGSVKDKEVIAPPIFVGDNKPSFNWNSPYLKTILSIAASLLLIILVGKATNTQINYSGGELKISFGEVVKPKETTQQVASLTPEQVQQMINASVSQNNSAIQANWQASQQALDASIKKNLMANSGKIDKLVHEASNASKDQIQQYVAGLQSENAKLVKDYFQLTSTDQKKYIEDLLVDFAKYMQQQRTSDMQVVQSRLNSLEKNTSVFKQETEQILSSIITNGGNATTSKEARNNY